MLDLDQQMGVIQRANLAPSVHNTQPARWQFQSDGTVVVFADEHCSLPIADPAGRDAAVSCGTAVEGTIMALADLGLETSGLEDFWEQNMAQDGLRIAARLSIRQGGAADPLSRVVDARATWRGGFAKASVTDARALAEWATTRDDVLLASARSDIEMLADLNETASQAFHRRSDYRAELVQWMRLRRSHSDFARDGLNLDALHLTDLEGWVAGFALSPRVYPILDRLGVAKSMMSERGKTVSSTAILLVHRARNESPLQSGRALYRIWLELTQLGFSAWPMAAVADDPDAATACISRFGLTDDRRLLNVLRVGPAPRAVARARRPAHELLVAQ